MAQRILIVEDQADVAELIEIVLKGEGYTVAVAPDGAQGLAAGGPHNCDAARELADARARLES